MNWRYEMIVRNIAKAIEDLREMVEALKLQIDLSECPRDVAEFCDDITLTRLKCPKCGYFGQVDVSVDMYFDKDRLKYRCQVCHHVWEEAGNEIKYIKFAKGSITSSHIVGYVKEQTLHGSYFIKDESLSKDFNKNYCCDCKFIGKPSGAPYEPHPGSICLCNQVATDNYVTKMKHTPLCKNINHDGICKYFQAKEG